MRDLERKFQRGGNGQLKTPIPELQPFETEGVCLLPLSYQSVAFRQASSRRFLADQICREDFPSTRKLCATT